MPGGRFAVLLMALACAACGRVTDSEQLRLCRAILPVLHTEDTALREIRAGPAALGKSGVRIDYAAREAGGERRTHSLVCGFGGTTFERDRLDLVAAESDGRAV